MAAISTEDFDELFDKGGDITPYMDMSTARHPNQERAARRISMDVPEEMVRGLDRAAGRQERNAEGHGNGSYCGPSHF